jgi:hypothetical protein
MSDVNGGGIPDLIDSKIFASFAAFLRDLCG